MRRIMLTALILVVPACAAGAQTCAVGICAGSITPNTGLPRALAGPPPVALGRNAYDFHTDALGITRDPSGNILPPADSLGLTRTRDGRICARDASGMLQCR